jgi:hypothetical protein
MKTSHIIKRLKEDTDYQEFFKKAMKKFQIASIGDMTKEEKKEFFDYVDKNYKAKTESFFYEESGESGLAVNEFGPLAGSKNYDQLEALKRDASRKSEKGDTIYVVGTKGGGFKISKYYEQNNTYAAYVNGFPTPVD